MPDTVIIGGGAAGLMAAVSAGRQGVKDICIIEKNERPARKVMITGKGRCNLTNASDNETLIKNTVRNGKFLYSAFSSFSSSDTVSFFENAGVSLKTERGNRVFPVSDKAVSIVDALVNEAKKYADIIHGTAVAVKTENGRVTGVVCEDGSSISAQTVIICTGGLSYPLTGSTGDGIKISNALGHTANKPRPSLVRLVCHEDFCTSLSGLNLKNVTLSLHKNGKKKPVYKEMGEMLFTHTGISGPLVLTASALIDDINKNYSAVIDLKPALTSEQLSSRILRDFLEAQNKDFINSLSKLLPKSLIPVIIKLSGIEPSKKVNQISKNERAKLVETIKNLRLTIKDFGPFEEAVITRGGIKVNEINPKTMMSKLINGLFFAGEIMDVDALTGGFNLQIAFSSGNLAGQSAADYIKNGFKGVVLV